MQEPKLLQSLCLSNRKLDESLRVSWRSHQWKWLRRLSRERQAAAYGWLGWGWEGKNEILWISWWNCFIYFFKTMWNTHEMLFGREAKGEVVRKLLILSFFFFFFCRNFRGNSHFSVTISILCIKHAPFTYSNQTSVSFEMLPKTNSLRKKVAFIESVPSLLGFLKEVFCFHPLTMKKAV